MSSTKPSILLIGNYPPPYGGVPRHFEYLVPYLLEKGWDVTVLSSGETGIFKHNNLTVYKPTSWQRHWARLKSWMCNRRPRHDIFTTLKKTAPFDWLRYVLYIEIGRQLIKRHRINIISAYNVYSYAPVGAYLSEQYSIPLVVTNFGEFYSHKRFFENNPKLVNYVCDRSEQLLAMSQHCADSYAEIGLQPNVKVMRYGGDIKVFNPEIDESPIRNRFGLSPDGLVVLFVGRLNTDMGLGTLLESIPLMIPKLQHVKYLVAGEKGDSLNALQQLAAKYPKQVFYTTSVPFDELPAFYAAASIIVAPTAGLRACGSLAAIEAMSTGKPVVAADIGGIPEIVQDAVTGKLVPADNAQALADGIVELCTAGPTVLTSMGQAGRKRVEEYFNEKLLDDQFEHLFKTVMVAGQSQTSRHNLKSA